MQIIETALFELKKREVMHQKINLLKTVGKTIISTMCYMEISSTRRIVNAKNNEIKGQLTERISECQFNLVALKIRMKIWKTLEEIKCE